MSRQVKDWTGFENDHWIIHSKGDYSITQRKYLWLAECKACGDIRERRTQSITRSISCGCLNPPPANKGKGKATKQDLVTGVNLLRVSWV